MEKIREDNPKRRKWPWLRVIKTKKKRELLATLLAPTYKKLIESKRDK